MPIRILKILPPKIKTIREKFLYFSYSAQNIDCGYTLEPPQQGSSKEYPQSMFLREIRNIMYTPVNPSFTKSFIKMGLKGVSII